MLGIDASTTSTIKTGTDYVGYNNGTVYKKFKVTSNRRVSVVAYEPSGSYTYGKSITICNSKKKAITRQLYTSSTTNYGEYFALKKGTYYVKISTVGLYYLNVSNSSKGTIAATSKKKAKTIKSSYKSYILPASTSKSSAWFKYNFKKAAKKTLRVQYTGDYSVTVSVYKGSKKVITRTLYNGSDWSVNYRNSLTQAEVNWPKGTFYVKISKNSKTDNGFIKIKMK